MSAALYERVWSIDRYAENSPGEQLAWLFNDVAKPDGSIIDFGCGSGKGTELIAAITGQKVTGVDWAANAPRVGIEFLVRDLTEPLNLWAEYGYCTDVLEHIEPQNVDAVLRNVLESARRVFFSISTVPDEFGKLVGEPLHLTVQPHEWWRKRLENLGAKVLWEQEEAKNALFYVTQWATGDEIAEKAQLNTAEQELYDNIYANMGLGLQEVRPFDAQDTPVILLAGGPSLADFEDEIVRRGRAGEIIVTTNGTYNWLLERGIKPAAQVMVDARGFNKRFLAPLVDTCKYLISSQCNHDAVASLPKEQTWLWHSGGSEVQKSAIDAWAKEHDTGHEWFPVYGGSTVVNRALSLLAMLGYRNVEVFGWDSCLRDDRHHAYSQPENDSVRVFDVIVDGRTFKCHPWMVVQANEVTKIIKHILGQIEDFNLSVRGDGLIAQILQHAASMAGKEDGNGGEQMADV